MHFHDVINPVLHMLHVILIYNALMITVLYKQIQTKNNKLIKERENFTKSLQILLIDQWMRLNGMPTASRNPLVYKCRSC